MGAEEQGGWRQPHRDYGHLGVTGARGGLELWVRQVLLVRGPHWTRPPPWAHVHTLVLACRRLREALPLRVGLAGLRLRGAAALGAAPCVT